MRSCVYTLALLLVLLSACCCMPAASVIEPVTFPALVGWEVLTFFVFLLILRIKSPGTQKRVLLVLTPPLVGVGLVLIILVGLGLPLWFDSLSQKFPDLDVIFTILFVLFAYFMHFISG